MPKNRTSPESPLLANTELPGGSWEGFLDEYSNFVLGCIRRLTGDPDERMDMYAHVCGRLRSDNCRRLRQFRGVGESGACKFTTWLATVTLNLSREWIRGHRGRRRLYRAIERLSVRHGFVFKQRYWHGMTVDQILHLARPLGLARTVEDVETLVTEVEEQLDEQQRWRTLTKGSGGSSPKPLDEEGVEGTIPVDPGGTAEQELHRGYVSRALAEAMLTLQPEARRILELRYREGKTARAVADELSISPYKRVYELQTNALREVRAVLERSGIRTSDLELSDRRQP